MAIEIQVDSCTRPSRTRARIQFASPYDAVVAHNGDKTLWKRAAQDSPTRRQAWSSSMALSTARSDHLSRYGRAYLAWLQCIRPSARPSRLVLVMVMHGHGLSISRSALCARSRCTCMMPWSERRAGVELSQKCFVRITSMLAVQWHATKRAWCATVLFIHHCDASTHRRLQSW